MSRRAAHDAVSPTTGEARPPLSSKRLRWLRYAFAFVELYFCLVVADYAIYRFGYFLPFPTEVSDVMTAWGGFDRSHHPNYRTWLRGFVLGPGTPWTYTFRGDTYKVLDVPVSSAPTFTLPVDANGFINTTALWDADVLILGDSFGRSAGCTLDETIPQLFASVSGRKTYSASVQGYGPYQYLALLDRLTGQDAPEGKPFRGRDVYVLIYLGNDFTSNMDLYERRRREEEMPRLLPRLRLDSLGDLSYLVEMKLRSVARAALGRTGATFDPTLSETDGYYPLTIDLPAYRDVRFAFDPDIAEYRTLDWLDDARKEKIRDIFAEFRRIAGERGVRLRFVLLPVNIQVLSPYVATNPQDGLEFFDIYREASLNLDRLGAFVKSEILAAGFPVLDAEPVLASNLGERLFWPQDTHLTPAGNRVIADAMYAFLPPSPRNDVVP